MVVLNKNSLHPGNAATSSKRALPPSSTSLGVILWRLDTRASTNTMSDSSPIKRSRKSRSEGNSNITPDPPPGGDDSCVYQLVLGRGYIPWYELEELQFISKDWMADIQEVRGGLPDWRRIISFLDSVNGLSKCENCDMPFKYECTCGKSTDPYSACLCKGSHEPILCCSEEYSKRSPDHFGRKHPRNQPGFALLSSFEKAMSLLDFHQQCVRNLLKFYPIISLLQRLVTMLMAGKTGTMASSAWRNFKSATPRLTSFFAALSNYVPPRVTLHQTRTIFSLPLQESNVNRAGVLPSTKP